MTKPPPLTLARRAALAGGLAALAAPRFARAAWPERTIRLLVPYGGGGQTDIVSRVTAEALQQRLGQAVLVDNRPGGAGNLAAETLARSPADGYTIGVCTMAVASGLNALLYRNVGYDWQKDFTPIGQFCSTSNLLLVHTSIPAADFPALVEWIKRNPGQFTYASAGVGAITHLIMEDLGARLGLDMVHVPYRQTTQAMTDLLAGRIHARCLGLPEGEAVRNVSSVRPMALTTPQRRPNWPGVPTMAETVPGFEGSSYFGLMAPAGTPPEVIGRLSATLADLLRDEGVRTAYQRVGADPAEPNTPEQFAALSRTAAEKWGPLIRRLNLVAQ